VAAGAFAVGRSSRRQAPIRSAADEDGDGDLHLLLASRQSVTRAGLSLVKFARRRRPAHVPGFGDWVTVLGVVVEGSHGEDEVAVSFSNITP
jgi:hypothetical protein